MKFWLPYTRGGSGSDVATCFLADGLTATGHEAIPQAFPHEYQYYPWALRNVAPPTDTEVIITNTWNGFACHRRNTVNITIEHLFVLDPLYRPYKTFFQAIFHTTFVRYFLTRSVRTADACVAVSDFTADAVAAGLNIPRPHTILNAVDTEFFSPPPNDMRSHRQSSEPFKLLFVGNFTLRKGADLMPAIMQRLGPGFHLDFTSGLRARASHDHPANMRNIGTLSRAQVRDAYRDAHALLFPSRLEGLPLTVMEALACGTPVIATNTSSLPEAVTSGFNGFLCATNEIDSFCEAARALAAEPKRWTRMSIDARLRAERQFSRDRLVTQYVNLARQLASERHRQNDPDTRPTSHYES
jgi:alpha-maltose-1-phosphate synthase